MCGVCVVCVVCVVVCVCVSVCVCVCVVSFRLYVTVTIGERKRSRIYRVLGLSEDLVRVCCLFVCLHSVY